MQGRVHVGVLLVTPLLALAVACSSAPADGVDVDRNEIVGGQRDTKHQAVVAIISRKGDKTSRCTGTIVKTEPTQKVGWVATAAHCITDFPPVLVLGANDFLDAVAKRYQVIDFAADARYTGEAGSPYDFGIVRIAGVDADTPSIPLVRGEDNLEAGMSVTSVGFGRTTGKAPDAGAPANSVRHAIVKKVEGVEPRLIRFDMSTDGFCFGDSGGPVLSGTTAAPQIVGIHSFVAQPQGEQGSCVGDGFSGRVTAAGSFFSEQMARPLPQDQCLLCRTQASSNDGKCAVARRVCLADEDCAEHYFCRAEGKTEAECKAEFPKGEAQAVAALGCVCADACVAECGETSTCRADLAPPPSGESEEGGECSVTLAPGACNTCVATSCCEEVRACADDPKCQACTLAASAGAVGSTATDSGACLANPLRNKLGACAVTKCANECAIQLPPEPEITEDDGETWSPSPDFGAGPKEPAADDDRVPPREKAAFGCAFGAGTSAPASDLGLVSGLALALAALARRRR